VPSAPKTSEQEQYPANVVLALAKIQSELGGIQKLSPIERRKAGLGGGDAQGINYAYRGIDQIAAAVQPLLGKYGVAIAPMATKIEREEFTRNGKPWVHVRVEFAWGIYGPGGPTDMIDACTFGEGDDNSDKGVNKATTAAYKNLLLRLFAIGDPDEDTDNFAPQEDDAPSQRTAPARRSQGHTEPSPAPVEEPAYAPLLAACEAKGFDKKTVGDIVAQITNNRDRHPKVLTPIEITRALELVADMLDDATPDDLLSLVEDPK